MQKNVLSLSSVTILIKRVQKLSATTICTWGNMTSSAMLYHCNITNKAILRAPASVKKLTLKQRILKFLIFYIKKEIPRGIKGNPTFFPTENELLNFEDQRDEWIDTIAKFPLVTDPLEGAHPVFGRLDTREWGRFVWLHMDHHLRQFGV